LTLALARGCVNSWRNMRKSATHVDENRGTLGLPDAFIFLLRLVWLLSVFIAFSNMKYCVPM
jgi:hypothetical protein